MATAPVKSQQRLHNFSLPFLKWGHKNQMNANLRYRRLSETMARESPPQPAAAAEHNRSSPSEQESDGGGPRKDSDSENLKLAVGSRSAQWNRFSFTSFSSQKQPAVVLERENGEGERVKVCDEIAEAEAEESLAKPWNLRPRKAVAKAVVEIGGVSKYGELQETVSAVPAIPAVQQTESQPKSMRLRGFAEGHSLERKEKKRKFWIALSREEIEEDVYAMTGSKPARRPKKRPKTVQKQLDNVFPGLYLVGITADSYRLHEALR